jgi:hypothetical protein
MFNHWMMSWLFSPFCNRRLISSWMGCGSRVIAVPGKPDTVRGYSANVVLTEFAFFENPDETWRAITPTVTNSRRDQKKDMSNHDPQRHRQQSPRPLGQELQPKGSAVRL